MGTNPDKRMKTKTTRDHKKGNVTACFMVLADLNEDVVQENKCIGGEEELTMTTETH